MKTICAKFVDMRLKHTETPTKLETLLIRPFPGKTMGEFPGPAFSFLSNLQGRECKKCNWKDAGMAWKAPSSLIGGPIWPR